MHRSADISTDNAVTERTTGVPTPRTGPSRPVVIAIASAPSDRERLAGLVDHIGPVLLVSDVAEARAFLAAHPQAGTDPAGSREVGLAGLRIDTDRQVATWDDREVQLTPLEYGLLVCLLKEPGHTWTFAHLHEAVWGTRHIGAGSDLHSLVKRARRKLARLGAPFGIDAIRGVGFRLADLDKAAGRALQSVEPVGG